MKELNIIDISLKLTSQICCNCEGTEQLRYAIENGFGGRTMDTSYIISKMHEFMFQLNGKMGTGLSK